MERHASDRRMNELSDEQLEAVAQRSAEIVWENFQKEVGKGTIRLFLYVIGAAFAALGAWLFATGKVGN